MDTKGEVGTAEDKRLRYLTILLWAAATDLSPCQRLRLAPAQLFFFFFFFKLLLSTWLMWHWQGLSNIYMTHKFDITLTRF
jgi:hypothetical protein